MFKILELLQEVSCIITIYRAHPKQMTFTELVNILRLFFVESKLENTFYFPLKYTIGNISKLPLEDAVPVNTEPSLGPVCSRIITWLVHLVPVLGQTIGLAACHG